MTRCLISAKEERFIIIRFLLCLLIKIVLGTCFTSLSVNRYLGKTQLGEDGYSHTVFYFILFILQLFTLKKEEKIYIIYVFHRTRKLKQKDSYQLRN